MVRQECLTYILKNVTRTFLSTRIKSKRMVRLHMLMAEAYWCWWKRMPTANVFGKLPTNVFLVGDYK
jgi:hypothetical protein